MNKTGHLVNKKIISSLQQLNLPKNERAKFVLAVSGGTDSQCLLKAFPYVLNQVYPNAFCIAAGVNHGLRTEADEELELAKRLAFQQQIPFTKFNIKISGKSNIQAKAREGRYDALFRCVGTFSHSYLTTAHHFDDRAETVLIRLLRGKNFGSLGVLPLLSGKIFRPMLEITREEILAYLEHWKIKYATDPSNNNTHYLRVKIRNELMPLLKSMAPNIAQRCCELADEALLVKK